MPRIAKTHKFPLLTPHDLRQWHCNWPGYDVKTVRVVHAVQSSLELPLAATLVKLPFMISLPPSWPSLSSGLLLYTPIDLEHGGMSMCTASAKSRSGGQSARYLVHWVLPLCTWTHSDRSRSYLAAISTGVFHTDACSSMVQCVQHTKPGGETHERPQHDLDPSV